jgi:hypothetical protein
LGSVVGEQKVALVEEKPVVVVEEGVALTVLALVEAGGTGRGGSCMPELALQRSSDC